jgi:hypothetical protein
VGISGMGKERLSASCDIQSGIISNNPRSLFFRNFFKTDIFCMPKIVLLQLPAWYEVDLANLNSEDGHLRL